MSELPEIQGYEILANIGAGGTSDVYKALRTADNKLVALKLVHAQVADPKARGRFEREALATSRVDHPSCVSVHDVGVLDDGRFYLVMEYVEGESLADLIAEGPLDVSRALSIADDICAGLQQAHAAEVIHRDIKPANIRVVSDGTVERARILDFGLAKLIGSAGAATEPLTAAGMAVGTPKYMAPEWLTSGDLGPQADLYAVAVVLYEMIAGRVPFDAGEPLEILTKHVQEPVPELPLAPDQEGAAEVKAAVSRGLEKDPARRFADAAEFRAAIAAARSALGDKKTLLLSAIPMVGPAETGTAAGPAAAPAPTPAAAPAAAPTPAAAPAAAVMLEQPPMSSMQRARYFARRWKRPLIAGAVALAVIIAVVMASGGSEEAVAGVDAGKSAHSVKAPSNFDDLIDSWDEVGLEPGGFAAIDPPPLGAERCQTGAAAGLDVTVCEYTSAAAASAAEKKGRETIGPHTGAAVASGAMLLIVADRKAVDSTGTKINTLIKRFAGSAR